ncbi:V8-like Glu-specific endopeptidase [Streptomyces olivoverticillatus]|uniref:V8-like Glu-specific endopeptidase n=1 Tax=Streptomyces olivoverticillatus TaxID=66427 RepID=A0A7W7PKX4_9ACTN|nr:hypothetical protein [Streptomyces olivoverticillatus]MBB4894711.1 V8-like Glu-specific endopeptidase [Streptomyces olivoverticillatus]
MSRYPLLRAAAAAIAGLLALPLAASQAVASPTAGTSQAAPDTTLHSGDRQNQALDAYWTPERMRSAVPADAPRPTGGPSAKDATPAAHGAAARQLAASQAPLAHDARLQGLNLTPTVGRVFFTDSKGVPRSCSASSVNNPTKNMVVTAGHCVHGGKGMGWHSKWTYVPAYWNGNAPYGRWSYHYARTFNGWIQKSDFDLDVAILNLWDNGGRLVDRVGGNGLGVNYGFKQKVTVWGYPADPPYNGSRPYYCQNLTTWKHSKYQVGVGCTMVGGASGGPWLRNYNTSTGLGDVYAVTSRRTEPPKDIWSPYFDNDIGHLYDQMAHN